MGIFEKLLEKVYSFFIIDVVFLDKFCLYKTDFIIKQFSSIKFTTLDNKVIEFKFSEILNNKTPLIRRFVAEIEASKGFTDAFLELNEKVVVVFKVIIVPINYKILSKLLYSVYTQYAYEYLSKKFPKQNT